MNNEPLINSADKEWIDNADYYTLLSRWRHAPSGNLMFQGETWQYYAKVMCEKRDAEPDGGVSASKAIGW